MYPMLGLDLPDSDEPIPRIGAHPDHVSIIVGVFGEVRVRVQLTAADQSGG